MKKLLPTLFFTLASMTLAYVSHAATEWTEFSSSSTEGKVKVYYSLASAHNHEHLLRVWQTQDYAAAQSIDNASYLSVKSLLEVNCDSKLLRTMAASYYTQNMGRGEAVSKNTNPSEWAPVASDMTTQSMAKFYCK